MTGTVIPGRQHMPEGEQLVDAVHLTFMSSTAEYGATLHYRRGERPPKPYADKGIHRRMQVCHTHRHDKTCHPGSPQPYLTVGQVKGEAQGLGLWVLAEASEGDCVWVVPQGDCCV